MPVYRATGCSRTVDGDYVGVGTPQDLWSPQNYICTAYGMNWIVWEIELASVDVSLTNVTRLIIGIAGGGTGVRYIDDMILTRP